MLWEREHLRPLRKQGFDVAEISFPTVDSAGCVKVSRNSYSTPLKPGRTSRQLNELLSPGGVCG